MEAQSAESYTLLQEEEPLIKSQTYSALGERIREQTAAYENLEKKLAECSGQLEELQDISVSMEADYEKQCTQTQEKRKETGKELASVRKRMEEGLGGELAAEAEIPADDSDSRIQERKQAFLEEQEEIGKCMEALEKLKYNREAENYFREWEEVSGRLENAEKEYTTAQKRQGDAEEDYRLQKQKIEQEMEIFALRKEDVPLKSIFIDDPVGHFDEMNIVGFVDLLR